jgi:hypothetical protein
LKYIRATQRWKAKNKAAEEKFTAETTKQEEKPVTEEKD